ncbi:MAG: hypothetical protein HY074_13645 [Deltaproteobacteria bacterium]|nr:hypothetical protein [Deltaproteobacteria bacterium]
MSPNKTVLSLLIIAMTVPSLASAAPARKATGSSAASKQKASTNQEEGDEAPRPGARPSAPSHSSAPVQHHEESRPAAPAPRPAAPTPRPPVVEQRHEESRPAPRPATPAPRPATPPVVEQKHEEKREERHETPAPRPATPPVVEQKHEEKREERHETPAPRPVTPPVVVTTPSRSAPSRAIIPPRPSEPARAHVEVVRTKSGNVVTPAHTAHIEESHKREQTVMRNNTRVNTIVTVHVNTYRTEVRPVVINRYNVYQTTYYPRYHDAYRPWYHYGFRGGFYYPVTPVYDIQLSFYNPIIFWMYADQYDETYYNTWYGSDLYSYRELQLRNGRPGVYFPTQTIRDLGLGVSTMPIRQQANFRAGLTKLADQLEWKLREGLDSSITLGRSDIVVSHFETLNDALVIEGFVSADARQFPFKALFDLNNFEMNMVFVPASFDGAPTADQLADLRELNERIAYYGGSVILDESDVASLPAPMPIDPTPTPVIVDETPAPVIIVAEPTPIPVIVEQPRPQPRVIVIEHRGRRGD